MRPAKHGAERVLERTVGHRSHDRECITAVRPRQPAIERLLAIQRAHDTGCQVAYLHAISHLITLIDGVREVVARFVECEFANRRERDRRAAGHVDEHHHRATRG